MNFFKSILSEDPNPSITEENPQQSNTTDDEIDPNANPDPNPNADPSTDSESDDTGGGGGWNFGGLIKTLATRSESVLETYRRDLQEFGTGLKNETVILREVASRAVKELPGSIEIGASVAHGAIDGVIKSTAEIITHGKETLLSSSDVETPETPETSGLVSDSGRYSRFEARLSALQNDLITFCHEPEDSEEYQKWKSGFVFEEKKEETENLAGENGVLEGVYKRVVPNMVDDETFWYRYFYRVYKLTQQENVRANLVKRAISIDDEEELSWDVDDEDCDEDKNVKNQRDGESEKKEFVDPNSPANAIVEKEPSSNESHDKSSEAVDQSSEHDVQKGTQATAEVSKNSGSGDAHEDTSLRGADHVKNEGGVGKEVITEGKEDSASSSKVVDASNVFNMQTVNEKEVITEGKEDSASSSKGVDTSNVSGKQSFNEKEVITEGKEDPVSSSKVVDASNVSSKRTVNEKEEDDMGWDEIEDIGSDNDKKESSTTPGEKQNIADVKKRLSSAEVDEDLSWDIEDED